MAKSKITIRKENGATCPRCRSADYATSKKSSRKPNFKCGSCMYIWQYGNTGGKYMKYL